MSSKITPTLHPNIKQDARPQRYSWAPGEYLCTCFSCKSHFAGDKRSGLCADCAYALPDPEPFNAAEMEATLTEQEYHVGFWESFGRAVAKEVGCLASIVDPRPEAGNAHIISAIQKLKASESHWKAIASSLSAGKAFRGYFEPESPEDPVDMFQRKDGSVYVFIPGREGGGIQYGISYEDAARLVRSGSEILRAARLKYAEEADEPHLQPSEPTEVGDPETMKELTESEFKAQLLRAGWTKTEADEEWERIQNDDEAGD